MPLIAHYKFDGNLYNEYSGVYGLNAVATNGSVTYITGRDGITEGALWVNGTNSGCYIPNHAFLPESGTWSAWINIDEFSGPGARADPFLTRHSPGNGGESIGFMMYIDQYKRFGAYAKAYEGGDSSIYTDIGTLETGVWHHLVYHVSPKHHQVFVDGSGYAQASIPAYWNFGYYIGLYPVTIGYSPDEFWTPDFRGAIDDVKIYDEYVDPSGIDVEIEVTAVTVPRQIQSASGGDLFLVPKKKKTKLDPIDPNKRRDEIIGKLSGSSPTKSGSGTAGRYNTHGYVPGALMFNQAIRNMRDYVEYEKFICRTLKDDDRTKQFKKNTEQHPESKYRLMYNSEAIDEHTVTGKKKLAKSEPEVCNG